MGKIMERVRQREAVAARARFEAWLQEQNAARIRSIAESYRNGAPMARIVEHTAPEPAAWWQFRRRSI